MRNLRRRLVLAFLCHEELKGHCDWPVADIQFYGRNHEPFFLQHFLCLRRSDCGHYSNNDASLPQSR
eukprot:15364933-Ditylum_brightwellii.AAC.1